MKRHPALQPVSREHHHVLAHARAIRWALVGRQGTPREAFDAFHAFWKAKIQPHFVDEETWLLPLVPADEDADRLRAEHADLRALVERILTETADAEPDRDDLSELARALDDHVRWEERELFPAIEASASPQELQDAGLKLMDRSR